jgi:hypothetical protein
LRRVLPGSHAPEEVAPHPRLTQTEGGGGMARSKLVMALALTIALVGAGSAAWADAPPGPYFNGFETNTAGWFNYSGATITRVPSGSASTYANGVSASSGSYYARLGKDTNPDSCTYGGGTASIYYGPYTKWGGYSSAFPTGGYETGVDIYLDAEYARDHLDTRFDWASAVNDTTGSHRRDFVFNVGTDALGFVITGGNNSTRCGADPADLGHIPVHVTTSGWYTFKHIFSGIPGGPLTVTLELINTSTQALVGAWVRIDPTDIIDVTVGGNRYGWFVQNEFDGLAIDNSYRTGATSTPNCVIKITNGGTFHADNLDKATFGGNARTDADGNASGQETYQDHGPLMPFTLKSIDIVAITCTDETSATIIGTATVNGSGTHIFEIQVHDGGEPSTSDTYGIRVPDIGYNSGVHALEGGNIQIS